MRACLVILVAAVMLLLATGRSTGRALVTADALGSQDALEAESGSDEEDTSDGDAAHLEATSGFSAGSIGARRPGAFADDPYDDGHRRALYRPPIA